MAFHVLENGAQMVIVYGDSTFEWSNTYHITKTDYDGTDTEYLAGLIHAAWVTLVNKPIASVYKLKRIKFYDLRSDGAPIHDYPFNTVAGTQSGEVTDKSSALVVTQRTASRGRSARGRVYYGGLTEGNMTSGTWTSGIVAAVMAWHTIIMNSITSAGFAPVVMSRKHNGQDRNPADAYGITSYESRSGIPGSQDRRNKRP